MDKALVYIDEKPRLIKEREVDDYNLGNFHRPSNEGPAICWPDGSEHYYENGKLHRDNGPAVSWPEGKKYWFVNDKRHNTKGPAVVGPDGTKEFWLNDNQYSYENWLKEKEKWATV